MNIDALATQCQEDEISISQFDLPREFLLLDSVTDKCQCLHIDINQGYSEF